MFFFKTKKQKKREELNKRLRENYASNKDGYKDKSCARRIAYTNSKLGDLCYLCRHRKAKDRHHPDYSKPKLVILLCKSCHGRLHHLLKLNRVRKEDK